MSVLWCFTYRCIHDVRLKIRGEGCSILSVLQTSGEGMFGIAGTMLSDCECVRTCSCG